MAETELLRTEISIEEPVERHEPAAATAPVAAEPARPQIEQHPAWPLLAPLGMPVSAEIPLARFKVRHLLALDAGQIVESGWSEHEDIRIVVAGVLAGWSEFEVEEQRLHVRLTRLA